MAHDSISRSLYVARLRRAFLLRAHPDRFRLQSHSIRKQQTDIVHAIADRLSAPDFLEYTYGSGGSNGSFLVALAQKKMQYKFVLEQKDGSLAHQNLNLDDSAENILRNMDKVLRSSGVSGLPEPPPSSSPPTPPTDETDSSNASFTEDAADQPGWQWARSNRKMGHERPLERRYDINLQRGRDLVAFLQAGGVNIEEIQCRKARRLDAISSAAIARQCYGFQAIDGTSLGWSSESLSRCLLSLVALHDEHHSALRVKSFYPIRLILSSDEFLDKLDLFGGTLRLNPASTPLQWLETLTTVTEDTIATINNHRENLLRFTKIVQDGLHIQIKKGYSCPSDEYHAYVRELAQSVLGGHPVGEEDEAGLVESSSSLTLGRRILVSIETHHACRRAVITPDGQIRIGTGMGVESCRSTIARFKEEARQRSDETATLKHQCKDLFHEMRLRYALRDLPKRVGVAIVDYDKAIGCAARLLDPTIGGRGGGGDASETKSMLEECLAGQSLGIGSSGQYCHLGDDGSIVIPWDWT